MSFSNYPYNQDSGFGSYTVIDLVEQENQFGKTYAQNELLPLNYTKLVTDYIDGVIPWIPLREIIRIDKYSTSDINDEVANLQQSIVTAKLLKTLQDYYVNRLMGLKIAMGVVTDITSELRPFPSGSTDVWLTVKAKVIWFSIPTGDYV